MALSQRDVDDRRNELQPCLHPSTKAQWPLLKSACQKQTLLTVQWAVQCSIVVPILPSAIARATSSFPPCSTLSPPHLPPPSRVRSPPPSGSPFEPGRHDLGSRLKVVWVAHCRTSHSFCCFRPGRRFRRRQFKVALVWKTKKNARSAKSPTPRDHPPPLPPAAPTSIHSFPRPPIWLLDIHPRPRRPPLPFFSSH